MTKPAMSVAEAMAWAAHELDECGALREAGDEYGDKCEVSAAVLRRLAPFVEAAMEYSRLIPLWQQGDVDEEECVDARRRMLEQHRAMNRPLTGKDT